MVAVAAGGTAILRINGTQYQLRGNMKVRTTSIERTSGRNADGSFYYTQKYIQPGVDMDISDSAGLALAAFDGFVDEYITLEMVTGKVYGISDAVFVGGVELDGVEGKFSAKFDGLCQEIL